MSRRLCSVLLALLAVGCSGSGEESTTSEAGSRPAPPPPGSREAPGVVAPGSSGSALLPFARTGDLYVLDMGCDCILAITPEGEISVAVTAEEILDAGGAPEIAFVDCGIAFDASGTMVFTESGSRSVLRRAPGGEVDLLLSGLRELSTSSL